MSKRVIISGLLVLVLPWVIYVVGVNIYLSSGGLESTINQGQDDVRVTFDSAWSWWPGRVKADGLRILGQDASVEWNLNIKKTNADIGLIPLLSKELRVQWASTTDITFHARMARPLDRLCKATGLPSIAGLANPLSDNCLDQKDTYQSPEAEGDEEDDDGDSWTVNLLNVGAYQLHTVWVESLQWYGTADVQGSWHFWSMVDMSFDDIDVEVHTGTVSWQRMRGRELAFKGNVSSSSISVTDEKAEVVWARLQLDAEGSMRLDADIEETIGTATVRDAATTFALRLKRDEPGRAEAAIDIRQGQVAGLGLRVTADIFANATVTGRPRNASFAGTTARVRNADFQTSSGRKVSSDWQADVTTKAATIIPPNARLSGVADFEASDARFVSAIIQQQSGVPGWVIGALADQTIKGTAEISLLTDAWFLRRAELQTNGITLLGHGKLGERPHAQVLFSSGGVSAGLKASTTSSELILSDASSRYHANKP